MSTKRVTFRISEADKDWLEAYSKAQRISLSGAIRQGIGLLRTEQRQKTYHYLVASTRGIWKRENGLDIRKRFALNGNEIFCLVPKLRLGTRLDAKLRFALSDKAR
ncbi:MAG: hypothetical protein PHX53_04215 [Syntrophales bacterium]|nr:hypothetical protein [Syntrophales bacterium]